MIPEQQREDMIFALGEGLLSPTDFVDRVVVPLVTEAERRGGEQALRDWVGGVRSALMWAEIRADRIAQGQP